MDTFKTKNKMENKIKEVQEYFRRKIVSGKYEVTEYGQHNWKISVDINHDFNIWVANGFEYISITGFMKIYLKEADRKTIWNRVVKFKDENIQLLIQQKEEEIEQLKNNLI